MPSARPPSLPVSLPNWSSAGAFCSGVRGFSSGRGCSMGATNFGSTLTSGSGVTGLATSVFRARDDPRLRGGGGGGGGSESKGPDGFPCPMSNEFNLVKKGYGLRTERDLPPFGGRLARSERGVRGARRSTPGHGRRAERDSLPRSERGVWGVRRSTPGHGRRAERD